MKYKQFVKLYFLLLLVCALFFSSCAVKEHKTLLAEPDISTEQTEEPETFLIAHRGYSSEYPENTREGFIGAFEKGFDGIEIDLWESENGDLMINHDSTTERTTGYDEDIVKINTKNRSLFPIIYAKGTKRFENRTLLIPTLEEAARITSDYGGRLLIHIKTKKDAEYTLTDKGVKRIIKTLKKHGITDKTMIFTTGKDLLDKFFGKGVRLGINSSPKTPGRYKKVLSWCEKNKISTLILGGMDSVERLGDLKTLSKIAADYGINLALYETRSKSEFRAVRKAGAEFALSDYYF